MNKNKVSLGYHKNEFQIFKPVNKLNKSIEVLKKLKL